MSEVRQKEEKAVRRLREHAGAREKCRERISPHGTRFLKPPCLASAVSGVGTSQARSARLFVKLWDRRTSKWGD